MVHPSEFYDDSCSVPDMSVSSVTSPCSSSYHSVDSPVFFSDEEMAQITSLFTPLIKENLKETICKRLVENGKPVPTVELKTSTSDQLTDEDVEKRKVRRERNKIAAQKCRSKKRERGDLLEQEAEILEGRRDSLEAEVEKLKREREILQDMLDAHAPFCKKMRSSPIVPPALHVLNNDHTYTLAEEDCQTDLIADWTNLGLELELEDE